MAKDNLRKNKKPAEKNKEHCHGGLGGTCGLDLPQAPGVIQNIANQDGAPNLNH